MYPINTLEKASTVDFYFNSGGSAFVVDLENSFMELELSLLDKVTNERAKKIADRTISTCNNLAYSIFSDLSIFLNETNVTPSGSHYGYKRYFEDLLNYSAEVKNTTLLGQGWINDDPNNFDSLDHNEGLKKRSYFFLNEGAPPNTVSHSAKFLVPLRLGLGNLQLLNGVNMKLRFTLQNPDFVLIHNVTSEENAHGYKIGINKMKIHLLSRYLEANAYESITRHLKSTPATHQFVRRELVHFNVAAGTEEFLLGI